MLPKVVAYEPMSLDGVERSPFKFFAGHDIEPFASFINGVETSGTPGPEGSPPSSTPPFHHVTVSVASTGSGLST